MDQNKKIECKYCRPEITFSDSKGKIKYVCKKNKKEISLSDCQNCKSFESKYIQYPIQISNIKMEEGIDFYDKSVGRLVKIRPCKEDIQEKTYLGIFLGALYAWNSVSYKKDTEILTVMPVLNSAVFVPELNSIIYGYESWWSFIENKGDFEDISDDESQYVWYMKMMKDMLDNDKEP